MSNPNQGGRPRLHTKKSKAPASSSMVPPDSDDDFVPCTYTEKKSTKKAKAPASSTKIPTHSDDDFVPCTYTEKLLQKKAKAPASSSKKAKAPASSMVDPDSDLEWEEVYRYL